MADRMRYTKKDLVNELLAVARLFTDERAEKIRAAAEFIAGGSTAQTPQREIVRRLEALGVACRTEVYIKTASPRMRSGQFRADIAVYRNGKLLALCECKPSKRDLSGRQRENYDACGIPYVVAGWDNVDEAIAWLARASG